ncbi:anthranilate synthase component I [Pseudidiomarina aestuarii]|uniref:Anthranilate synthase component 1 n=1 Tax=Pseudidiomarina aestuarii TaxID=624146 RepID=A0A7Z6ZU39_9GAMM|nr:anthranilate synthase component 1 [Pseudidiomarina aestuarii]RUO41267.1 anthranilate synthase component I [Pseudidiomarina aestuarii]
MSMIFEQQLGHVTTLQIQLPYQADTLALFQRVCGHYPHTMLLDSAEVNSKRSLKSLVMVTAALQITCQQQTIRVKALTNNGQQLLPWLAAELQHDSFAIEQTTTELTVFVTPPAATLDEDSRLRALANDEPLRILQQRLQQTQSHPLGIYLGGVFAYDYVASFEQLPDVPNGSNDCPDYQFYLAETLVVVDHQAKTTELLANLISGPECESYYATLTDQVGKIAAACQLPPVQSSKKAGTETTVALTATPSADVFAQQVTQLKEHILAGDIFQVVPSRRFQLDCSDALAAYAELKRSNPSPYMFFLRTEQFELFGASPESALKYTAASNQVELYPIAGTRPRGKHADGSIHADLDSRLELDLRLDQKELAEHMMLVDLARNDLARIAEPGTRYVADLLQVDRYSHVMHLVSRVVAQLAPDLDALHAYRACMNMGTLVGAPKLSAARLIREVEQQRRGSYGGAVGYLAGNGDMDTCIVIRSAFVQHGRATVQAGAGVVYDSVPSAEVAETEAKAKAVIRAIQTAMARGDQS